MGAFFWITPYFGSGLCEWFLVPDFGSGFSVSRSRLLRRFVCHPIHHLHILLLLLPSQPLKLKRHLNVPLESHHGNTVFGLLQQHRVWALMLSLVFYCFPRYAWFLCFVFLFFASSLHPIGLLNCLGRTLVRSLERPSQLSSRSSIPLNLSKVLSICGTIGHLRDHL